MAPAYLKLCQNGKLSERIHTASDLLRSCRVCPRHCEVNRLADEAGQCKTGRLSVVSSYGPHFGEEPPVGAGKIAGDAGLTRLDKNIY